MKIFVVKQQSPHLAVQPLQSPQVSGGQSSSTCHMRTMPGDAPRDGPGPPAASCHTLPAPLLQGQGHSVSPWVKGAVGPDGSGPQ